MKLLDKFFQWWDSVTKADVAYQFCHFLVGYSWVLSWGQNHRWFAVISLLLFAAWKEFWFDRHFESPELSGGLLGDLKDFCMYQVGLLAALLRLAL